MSGHHQAQITSDRLLEVWRDSCVNQSQEPDRSTWEGASQTATPNQLAVSGPDSDGTHDFAGGTAGSANEIDDTANTAANTPTVSGDFNTTDSDNGESEGPGVTPTRAPTYAILDGTGGNAALVSAPTGTTTLTYTVTKGTGQNAVTWGMIAVNTATGAWTFTANAAALNSLYNGEQETITLTARVTDAASGTDSETFDIILTGANDAPDITGVLANYDIDAANRRDSGR